MSKEIGKADDDRKPTIVPVPWSDVMRLYTIYSVTQNTIPAASNRKPKITNATPAYAKPL